VVVVGWASILLTNYRFGTQLLGWDVMDSSFNPALNIWRSLTSVWQSHQGLGFLGGHGYLAQLPHALIQFLLSIILPAQLTRYVFAFGCLLLGALGVQQLLEQVSPKEVSSSTLEWGKAVSGLLYLLHLGSVQTFYVHLEPFIVMYAGLPWIFWILARIFTSSPTNNARNWLLFFTVNFFMSIIGFIPPVFVWYVIFVSIFLGCQLFHAPKKLTFFRSFGVAFIIAVVNAYWLLPVAVFTVFDSSNYLNSKLNRVTTPEYASISQAYGTLAEAAQLRSFYFETYDQDRFELEAATTPIMWPWINHQQLPLVSFIGFFIFVSALLGWIRLGLSAKKEANAVQASLVICGVITFAALARSVPVFTQLNELVSFIPVLNQAFRLAFSKLSMAMVLFLSIGVGSLFIWVFAQLEKNHSPFKKNLRIGLGGIGLVSLLWYALPAFTGNYLYKGARVQLPSQYGQLYETLRQLPQGSRVAPLPILTYTGWDIQTWNGAAGYTGSGFHWYATNTPLLHRSFDVWSQHNEGYRNELNYAWKQGNVTALTNVFQKYHVTHVLVDRSIFVPNQDQTSNKEAAQLTDSWLTAIPGLRPIFKQGDIELYEVTTIKPAQFYITNSEDTTKAEALAPRSALDLTYQKTGPYVSGDEVLRPFTNTFEGPVAQQISIDDREITIQFPVQHISENTPYEVHPPKPGTPVLFSAVIRRLPSSFTLTLEPLLPTLQINNEVIVAPKNLSFDLTQEVSDDPTQAQVITLNGQPLNAPSLSDELPLRSTYINLEYGAPLTLQVKVDENEELRSVELPADVWQQAWAYPESARVVLFPNDVMVAKIPSVFVDAPLTQPNTLQNCDGQRRGQAEVVKNNEGVLLKTQDWGALCEYFLRTSITDRQGRVIFVEGERRTGKLPRVILLPGVEKPTYFDDILKDTSTNYFNILPSTATEYFVGLEEKSFGNDPGEYQLRKMRLYVYPAPFLNEIVLLKSGSSEKTKVTSTPLSSSWQFGSGILQVKLQAPNAQLLEMNQSFDSKWLAYSSTSGFLDHQVMSSWANAWQVPAGEHTILIFYWPQMLSFAGYGVLLIGAGWLVWRWRKAAGS
jgi:hypothetical protein